MAEVYDPERQQEVELTAAEVERAKAAVEQSKAMVTAAEAEVKTAEANVDVRKTEISQTAVIRRFREKEYIRYMESPAIRPSTSGSPTRSKTNTKGPRPPGEGPRLGQGRRGRADPARAQVLTAKANWNTHGRATGRRGPLGPGDDPGQVHRAFFPLIRV